MSGSRLGLSRVFLYLLLSLSIAVPAYAQGSFFSRLSGTVVDSEGLPIPGANVKVKNLGTNDEIDLVTGGDGTFTAQNIPGGKYSVVVELAGFRTTTLDSVSVSAGIPAAVKVTMQVGTIAENVTVVGDSATVIQSQSPAIATNLTGAQITSLPLTSRNALDSLTSLAGFNTSGTARNSTVSGLPRSAINITLDGMSVQDNYLKTTDGYFARLSPLLDSVEEVTVTTAGNTADATGQGAVQIRFVTKSGTNSWTGTGYEYFRHDALNANTFFRNRDLPPDPETGKAPKNQLRQYTQGFAQGGPIKRDKAFFFFNYEERRSPSASTLQRNILTPEAASGVFTYGNGLKQNLLQIAAANGQIATIDPTVGKILANIQSATTQSGGVVTLNNPLVQQYTWSMPTSNFDPSPTMRLDYELTKTQRLTGSFNYRHINSTPDTTNSAQLPFPNSLQTGSQQSTRWTTSESLRSTFGDNLFNEFRLGASGGATFFSPEFVTDMFSDTGGYRLNFNGACCGTGALLTNWSLGAGQSSREASTRVLENTTTWLKGNHNMQFGATMVQAMVWLANQTLVPTANFDIVAGEPADAIFNATSLPGASTTDITQAKRLYAMLTGRISSLAGDARINAAGDAYNMLGKSRAEGQMREFNVFVSDSWRASPNLTISGGLRYVLANPFYPTNDSYTTMSVASLYGVSGEGNIWRPGTLTGAKPQFVRFAKGEYAYNPDRNNIAPSVGAAWQVPPSDGFMGWLRGREDGDVVLRAGWAMAFQRPGMSDFTGVFGDNQGIQVTLNRDVNNSSLPAQPILLRNNPTLPGAPSVSLPSLPASITTRANVYDPNIQMPYTQSWSAGWQRKISRDSVLELRYVGSRHLNDWDSINLNEPNITTNGFLNEFRLAQANLQANIAAGRGATFAYMGAGTGTNPLPIFLAHFSAQNSANAGNAAVYTSTQFTNATNLGFLAARNPNPWGFASPGASGLIGNATFRNNAVTAGLPVNFFVTNPDLLGATTGQAGAANLTMNSGGTRAHSMQVDIRKRFSHGFAVNPSYTFSIAEIQRRFGYARPLEWIEQAGQVGNVRHALKANFQVEIPVGKERKFGAGMGSFLDTIIGGWSFDGVARWQTGEVLDFGNVRLVGMTKSELQKEIKIQEGSNGQIFTLPADILDNTARAFDVSATSASGYGAKGAPSGRYFAPANGPDCIEEAPGYGDCGARQIAVNGPSLFRVDLGISKKFDLPGRFSAEFRGEMLNALNDPYFNPASTAGTPLGFTTTNTAPNGPGGGTPTVNTTANNNVDNYRLTDLLGDNQARLIQLVWRLRW